MPGSRTASNDLPSARNGSNKRSDRAVAGVGHPSKRIRVSRACDQCRAGREKCDGVQPTCNACQIQERPCTYNEQPKKRGIQPNYIRTLELTLTWIFQNFPETEARLSELIPDPGGDAHRVIAFKDAGRSEELHQLWRSGLVCRQIDQMLSGAVIENPETSSSDGLTQPAVDASDMLPVQDSHIIDEGHFQTEVSLAAKVSSDNILSLHGSVRSPERGLNLLRLPHASWSLLEHYFAFTQSWLPITEKHDILKLMYQYPPEGLPPDLASGGDHAELWSLMALSAHQQGNHADPDISGEMLKIARSLVPLRAVVFELGHAKALLIQCLIEMDREAWLAAWLAVGSAVRILTYLSSDMERPKILQIGRARHTFLAAFLLESSIASRIGAHTHLKRSIVQEIGLPIEDGLEEWSPWRDPSDESESAVKAPIMAISTFNKLIKLAERLTVKPSHDRSLATGVVLDLLRNGSPGADRRQPSIMVTEGLTVPAVDRDRSRNPVSHSETNLSPSHVSSSMGRGTPSWGSTQPGSVPFMSVPNAPTDSATGSTPVGDNSKTDSPGQLSTNYAQSQNWDFDVDGGDMFSADIFEELASLERTDDAARPQFMQNLGFGPDLDLAEFFGADYQLSDPMLAHLQT